MSKILDSSWIVVESLENADGNRCVDLFVRPDLTYGFEEFRRDPEDGGVWTRVQYYANQSYASKDKALRVAKRHVIWLGD